MSNKKLDPKKFGLPGRTIIEEIGKDHLVLVIDRKSRLIMADGKKILTKAEKIRGRRPGCQVSLSTTAPVCSKTVKFLSEHNIEISS